MSTVVRKIASETATNNRGRRNSVTLARCEVLVDGEVVGHVFQHRAETTTRYSGSSVGKITSRTCWAWESLDNEGDYELSSRKAAVQGLLEAVEA